MRGLTRYNQKKTRIQPPSHSGFLAARVTSASASFCDMPWDTALLDKCVYTCLCMCVWRSVWVWVWGHTLDPILMSRFCESETCRCLSAFGLIRCHVFSDKKIQLQERSLVSIHCRVQRPTHTHESTANKITHEMGGYWDCSDWHTWIFQ